jgi:hypothetical protein
LVFDFPGCGKSQTVFVSSILDKKYQSK